MRDDIPDLTRFGLAQNTAMDTGVGAVMDWTAITGVATAAGSIVGAGALVVAALTLVSEGRRWRADRRHEEQERHAAEQGLASFVSAITESTDDKAAAVVAANDGDRPVF